MAPSRGSNRPDVLRRGMAPSALLNGGLQTQAPSCTENRRLPGLSTAGSMHPAGMLLVPGCLQGGREKPALLLYFSQFKCLKGISAHALTLGDVIAGDPSVACTRGFGSAGVELWVWKEGGSRRCRRSLMGREITPALQPVRFWPKFFTVFVLTLYLFFPISLFITFLR